MKTYWLIGNKNYSVQNDSLVCHWNPEISRRKKISLGSGRRVRHQREQEMYKFYKDGS